MAADDIFERTAARLMRFTLLAAIAGTIGATVWKGFAAGGSFAIGAFVSFLNLRWLAGFVGSLGPQPKRLSALFLLVRYTMLALGAYVIVKYTKINVPAALTGLFVALAGAVFEVIAQLTYARRNLGN